MRAAGMVFGILLVLLGMVFCAAAVATGLWQRWILGGMLSASGLLLLSLSRLRPERTTIEHHVELPGDTHLQSLTCERCGGSLDSRSVTYRAGAIFVTCPYCEANYQLEEEPKW